jgi:FtsP/CotA-like multicopper oxidase with cupredoxin domain
MPALPESKERPMNKIKRRDVLKGGGAMLVGSLLQNKVDAQETAKPKPDAGNYRTLECKWIEKKIGDHKVRLRSYNGQVPGPMLKARPGETLRIRVRNKLPHYDSTGWNGDHNVPHLLNTTNLHLHGLDIVPHLFEPVGTTNPLSRMIAIEPGAQYDYTFKIPADHPPGLYWYHPHHHGSTAVQAISGMAGGLIIYGNIDEVPEIKAARDIPLVIQDLGLFESETRPDVWEYEPKQNAIWQTFQSYVTIYDPATGVNQKTDLKGGFSTGDYKLHYYLVNGEPFFRETHNPTTGHQTEPYIKQLGVPRFKIAPGEVVRFRMLNATSDNMMPIAVEDHTMYLIALDGVNFPAVQAIPPQPIDGTTPQILLAPANRAEFLIQGSKKPGLYRIAQQAQSQQFIQSAQKIIAEIEVANPPKNMSLPTTLPTQTRYYPFINPKDVQRVREIEFSGAFPAVMNPYVGGDFSINNALYQETAVPNVVNLTGVEEWHIIVGDAHHGGTEGHPFHIHVNHFEVISITTTDSTGKTTTITPNTIQDTIWVPANSTAVIRMKFREWSGKSVYHCHILPHEDTGMMGNFLITTQSTGSHHPASAKRRPAPPKK